jgi:hypothetical protein
MLLLYMGYTLIAKSGSDFKIPDSIGSLSLRALRSVAYKIKKVSIIKSRSQTPLKPERKLTLNSRLLKHPIRVRQ